MIKRLNVALVTTMALLASSADPGACGDKFLRLGRVLRLAHAAYPSSILIYSGADAGAAGAAKQLKLAETLKQAGHKVREIKRDTDLAPAMKAASYDLILGSPSVAASAQAAPTSAKAPRFVPLLLKPTLDERTRAEHQFGAVLTSGATSQELVAKVDAIIEQGRPAKASR